MMSRTEKRLFWRNLASAAQARRWAMSPQDANDRAISVQWAARYIGRARGWRLNEGAR